MTRRWMFASVAALAIASALAGVVASACSSNAIPSLSGSPLNECLPTLALANGSACADGLVCPYELACGPVQVSTSCTCESGTLVCVVAGDDASLPSDTEPSCAQLTNPAGCPSHEPTSHAACSSVGLACVYRGVACASIDAGVTLDTCECQGGDDGGPILYSCSIAQCPSDDGGLAAVEGGDGATLESGAGDASDAGGDGSDDSG
jgi:hypothetical protein